MGKKERSSAATRSGLLPARNTLEHIPLAANAVMIGNLGQANQVTTMITAINRIQSNLLISFFMEGGFYMI
jgi:hypothetical protein